MKWITEIEVYPGDYKGTGSAKAGLTTAPSRFSHASTAPAITKPSAGSEQKFRGIAFGGPNSISKVELSFDAGRTWNECTIEPPMSPYSWVIWNYTWTAQTGQVPNRGPRDGYERATADCRNCPATARWSKRVTHHYFGRGAGLTPLPSPSSFQAKLSRP